MQAKLLESADAKMNNIEQLINTVEEAQRNKKASDGIKRQFSSHHLWLLNSIMRMRIYLDVCVREELRIDIQKTLA